MKSAVDKVQLLARLRDILPAHCLIAAKESQRPFECDALPLYRELPLVVALPETAAQAGHVLRLCHELDVPVVARGSGTGLCAGAMPHPEGVLLVLTKLDRVLAVNPLGRWAKVQCGVSNLAISQAVAPHGLYYGPDPSSQVACSIGGNIAANSGGVHCLKYGLTVHNVLALTVLTVTGETLQLGGHGLDGPGLDLLALMHGSEGLLGVVTDVTVKLLPQPEAAQVVLAGFDTVTAAADAVAAVIAAGIIPAGLEMMDSLAIQAAEDFCQAGYPRDAAAILLCEVDGSAAEVAQHSAHIRELFRVAGASSLVTSDSEEQRALLWRGRKSAFPAVGRLSPDYYCMDGTIPRGQIAYVLSEIQRLSEHYQLRVANVFHAGDGNLHPLILFEGGDPDSIARAEAFGADILSLSVSVGGCLTGEHGVGVEKLRSMDDQFTRQELLQLETIKAAFDPSLTLNPGKGIPILKRCQEYRALPDRHQHDTTVNISASAAPGDSRHPDALETKRPSSKASLHEVAGNDIGAELQAAVKDAFDKRTALAIQGGNSKAALLGRTPTGAPLSVANHRGIIRYEPGELVLRARAGTSLADIETVLHNEGQELPFEPPVFKGRATLGGTLACNLSGPARPWRGSIRDATLGIALINGLGEQLHFGGQVMKNVAGYDVSRLQAGALGTLGIITEVCIKVLPRAEHSLTLCFEMDPTEAIAKMAACGAQAKPLTGACWTDEKLYLRLAGAADAVIDTAKQWGGEQLADSAAPWSQLREFSLPFFAGEPPLWRLSLASDTAGSEKFGAMLIDWGGAQRWVRGAHSRADLEGYAANAGGHLTLFRGGDRSAEVRSLRSQTHTDVLAPNTEPAVAQSLHERLKNAFDPRGIFNPGRLYTWL